jgi:hypothetical protein
MLPQRNLKILTTVNLQLQLLSYKKSSRVPTARRKPAAQYECELQTAVQERGHEEHVIFGDCDDVRLARRRDFTPAPRPPGA